MTSQGRQAAGRGFIQGRWCEGTGQESVRQSPTDGQVVWRGRWSGLDQVETAIQAGCAAFETWSLLSEEERVGYCRTFADVVTTGKEELAALIAMETGKPLWEARTEVATVVAKVGNSIDALRQRRSMTTETVGDYLSVTRYRPYGTMLVLGPYNLPAHLPGAHIIPALLAGNTIVFKPSELTPAVGQWLVEAWEKDRYPCGSDKSRAWWCRGWLSRHIER